MKLINVAFGLFTSLLCLNAQAATYTVTTTTDSGAGSLRQAIADANATPANDTIGFNIQAGDPNCFSSACSITLTSGELAVAATTAGGELIITNSTGAAALEISGNNASRVFHTLGNSKVTLDGVTIINGNATAASLTAGGGIYNEGNLTLTNAIVAFNDGGVLGGGIFTSGPLTVTNTSVHHNKANAGGGIYNFQTSMEVTSSTISDNEATGPNADNGYECGGLFNNDGSATITDTTIDGNTSNFQGGGVYNLEGVMKITRSTISNNSAVNTNPVVFTVGGGISNRASGNNGSQLEVINCTISGNSTGGAGGGVYNQNRCTVQLVNATITENSATRPSDNFGGAGGVDSADTSTAPATTSRNTIIAGNIAGPGAAPDVRNTSNGFTSLGHNLIGNTTGAANTWDSTDKINTDPKLLALADNGGPTKTHALQSDSPAIDAGDNCVTTGACSPDNNPVLTTDQRSYLRPGTTENPVDIGAFEFGATPASPSPTPTPTPTATPTPTPTPIPTSPPVTIVSPENGAEFSEGSSVEVQTQGGSSTSSVGFYDNGQLVTRATGASPGASLAGLRAGVHLLTVIAETPGGTDSRSDVRIVINPAGGNTYTFTGAGGGDWNNPGNWTPEGVPGPTDSAIVGNSVSIPADLTLRALSLEGGAVVTGPGNLTVSENFTFFAGTLRNLALLVPVGGRLVLLSDGTKAFEGVAVRNEGTVILSGPGGITGDAATSVQNFGLFTFALQGDTSTGQYVTEATVGTFTNNGTVEIDGGSLKTVGEYVQEAGETNLGCARLGARIEKLYGRIEALNVAVESGTMTGSGRILGNLVTRLKAAKRAFLRMGCSPGVIEVTGDLTLTENATMIVEIGGTDPEQYDQLKVGGKVTLDGNLIVNVVDGFTPGQSDSFNFLSYGSVEGSFDSVSANAQTSFGPNGAEVNVAGPNPPAPKALNIATRMRVETGDNVLIAGFIITGSQSKKVLVRGIGPSLPVNGALTDPTLDLDAGTFFNDDWRSDQHGDIEATTIPPSSDLESAIVATLEPGAHTAVLRGKSDGTGVGLVEVYDLESGTPAQLANISTRGQVQTGDNVMIGGFIIDGDYPATVLLRAIGPSLPVAGTLQDPTLELVDSNGASISNDNWRETQEAEITATTVPPTDDNEAAIVATLVPGAYTAVVRGKDDTVGVALVEGYNLQ